MSEKLQISIYKLKEKITGVDKKKNLVEIDITLELLKKAFKKANYKNQEVKNIFIDEYELHLFYKLASAQTKWKEFIAEIAKDGEEIIKYPGSYNESFILLQ